MKQDIADSETQSKAMFPQLQDLVRDSRAAQLLRTQISHLPPSIFTLRLAYNHLFVIIDLGQYKKTQAPRISSPQIQPKASNIESSYSLKISKRFPLKESVRLLMLDGGFQPKISDSRDLMEEVMAQPYHYSMSFIGIVNSLVAFDLGLQQKNEKFLEMQKIGKFDLGERYFYQEISQLYSSLVLLKDISVKGCAYIGVSETHILTFRQLEQPQKQSPGRLKHPKTMAASNEKELPDSEVQEQTPNELILTASAELQCIDSIHYKQNQKLITLLYRKYKSIKLYHQFEQIKRQFKLNHPQILLRAVLKHITKFQECSIQFQPYRQPTKKDKKPTISESMVVHRENERINYYIDECAQLQQLLWKKQSSEEERRKAFQNLNRFYQKLIEYFSTRANPYYLIYVNKLNLLCSKFYQKPSNSQ